MVFEAFWGPYKSTRRTGYAKGRCSFVTGVREN